VLSSTAALLSGAAVALLSAAALMAVAAYNSNSQTRLESKRIEASRILEMIKDKDPEQVRRNLYWLFETQLVTDKDLIDPIKHWYDTHDPKQGPAFPQHIRAGGIASVSAGGTATATQGPPPAPPP
jgi:hypothetical protein